MASDQTTLDPSELQDTLGQLRCGNVLVRGPPMTGKRSVVLTALEAADPGLLIATSYSPARHRPPADYHAPDLTIVDCTPGEPAVPGDTTVGSPGDLTGIAMAASKFVTDAAEPVVAIDSVSTLLMYADTAPVFRFLNVMTGHVRQSAGTGLYTVDTGSHPPVELSTLAELFDGSIDLSLEGDKVAVESTGDVIPLVER